MASTKAKIGFIKGNAIIDVAELPNPVIKSAINPTNSYDKIYFNTSLSGAEVTNIISKLTMNDLTSIAPNSSPMYIIYASESSGLCLCCSYDTYDNAGEQIITSSIGSFIFTGEGIDYSSVVDIFQGNPLGTPYGWLIDNSMYDIDLSNGVDSFNGLISIGQENELLKDLIYVEEVNASINTKALYRLPDGTLWYYYNGKWNAVGSDKEEEGTDLLQIVLDTKKDCASWFENYKGEELDISKYDFSKVTNLASTFKDCTNVKELALIDMSSNRSLYYTFRSCMMLKEIKVSNTGKVTNMGYVCYNCPELESIGTLDMNSVPNNSYSTQMFEYCKKLTNLSILNIRTNLKIGVGDGTGNLDFGCLLTLDSLINACKELINVNSARTLTMGTANLSKIANTYVKFVDSSQTEIAVDAKGDVVVCESTDSGAMLLSDYALLKNWTLA